MMRSCDTYREEDVLAWILGDSEVGVTQELAEHMVACPVCRARAEEYLILHRSADRLRSDPVIRWRGFDSPFGAMRVAASGAGLVALSWQDESDEAFVVGLERRHRSTPVVCDTDELDPAEEQLTEYFDRRRPGFDLSVDLARLGDFPARGPRRGLRPRVRGDGDVCGTRRAHRASEGGAGRGQRARPQPDSDHRAVSPASSAPTGRSADTPADSATSARCSASRVATTWSLPMPRLRRASGRSPSADRVARGRGGLGALLDELVEAL